MSAIELISREESLLSSLLKFYEEDPKYLNILSLISKQKTSISLREMDYTVTNYSNNNKVIYKLENGTTFNMYLDYKCQLRGYSKKCFDPFCRRQRIFLDFEKKKPIYIKDEEIDRYKTREDGIVTTIGQLAFFKWAILNEVIDYCFNNKVKIGEEMDKMDKKKKNKLKSEKEMKIEKEKEIRTEKEVKMIIQFS